jgi:hypothetical protein
MFSMPAFGEREQAPRVMLLVLPKRYEEGSYRKFAAEGRT